MIPIKFIKKINYLWSDENKRFWWGDPLDVRFYLSYVLSKLRNKQVLDVACNTGIVSSQMKTCNVVGVDLNSGALSLAKVLNPDSKFYVQDIFTLNKKFRKESFDVIILSHILPKDNFASDRFPEELLDVVIPLLKKKGFLYLTTPNPARAFNGKNKFITDVYLKHLLNRYNLKYTIQYWCKWNIHFNHFFKFFPFIWVILEKLSKKKGRSVSFYVEAIKK